MTASPRTKILSIVGPGRSGTTVLASIMGEAEGVVSAGELRWLWRRGLIEGRHCGCGRPPAECPVWSEVLEHVGGGPAGSSWTARWAADVVAAQDVVSTRANRLRVIRSASGGDRGWEELDRVRAATGLVCGALAAVAGAGLVVDTSKRAQDAAIVAALDGVEHYVLHIVRDPRAVAYSWGRSKPNPALGRDGAMRTRGAVGAVGRWTENCLGAEVLRRHIPAARWRSLRYEDFVAAPRATIESLFDFVGVDARAPFEGDSTVRLGGNHTVAGNPNRFRTGPVAITVDDEWRRRLSGRDRRCVEAVAFPLMLRYGYPVRAATRG